MKRSNSDNLLPTIMIILGATGDLAKTKLLPSLFRLYEKGQLPSMFQIVGFSRRDWGNEEFQAYVLKVLKSHTKDTAKIKKFVQFLVYQQGDFERRGGYNKLALTLGLKDEEWRVCANKLFYLAVPPQFYKEIFEHLSSSGLTEPCSPEEGWTRVIVEKPFGKDLKTAQELDRMLGNLFEEEQVYRIDHYLGKETVQNILAFRFSNSFFEPAWDNRSIEKIEVRLLERDGIGERGEFYDGIGALRDVGQNHLLQLLSLFLMDNPGAFAADSIRAKRAEVLNALKAMTVKEVEELTVRGQYEGYGEAKGVAKNSKTETYFRLLAEVDTPRWKGVPILLESGKSMKEDRVEVIVTFRHQQPCLCPPGEHYKNQLNYHIQPTERIFASFWVKKPGSKMVLEKKDFSFDYREAYSEEEFIDAYEKLLAAAISGDQTLFVSTEEILASWKFIDPIISAWKTDKVPLSSYKIHSKSIQKEEIVKEETLEKSLGFIGLGKMGRNMVSRLSEHGWRLLVFDEDAKAVNETASTLIKGVSDLKELAERLASPRIIWLMVPAGKPVDDVLDALLPHLLKGDIIIDGGNSFFEDSQKRAARLKKKGIYFLDVGVSGGPGGARRGASLMIGGDKEIYEKLTPLFSDLSVQGGFGYMGKAGAGHFVKMVHNGIEYGMMQSLAEGFALMKKSPFSLDLKEVARIYNEGSVVESRLVGWLLEAFDVFGQNLKGVSGRVSHTGEGEWTIKTAKKFKVAVDIISRSFAFRVNSLKKPSYTGQILSALRNRFGGHKKD
ncbi:MAG TPA: glucose-6-phosphate dehydrogenase [Candidatus Wildermuthbacteria bacterium]|nr:glucose-6-phosphate dehydrogenase [Candidatus Wildermuthbacteria bacterium]